MSEPTTIEALIAKWEQEVLKWHDAGFFQRSDTYQDCIDDLRPIAAAARREGYEAVYAEHIKFCPRCSRGYQSACERGTELTSLAATEAPAPCTEGKMNDVECNHVTLNLLEGSLDMGGKDYVCKGCGQHFRAEPIIIGVHFGAPPGYPKPCGLCGKQIDSENDTEWHGLGNCVPICERCSGSGIEPLAGADAPAEPLDEALCICGHDVSKHATNLEQSFCEVDLCDCQKYNKGGV